MKVVELGEKIEDKIVLCLGYFDLIHLGHIDLINKAKKVAQRKNAKLAIFTFNNDLSNLCLKMPSAYTFKRRVMMYEKLGFDYVINTEMNETFKSIGYKEFLKYIFEKYEITAIATGSEYRFGKNREGVLNREIIGDVELITSLILMEDGTILSSSVIKELLSKGQIKEANKYLFEPFKIYVKDGKIEGNHILENGKYLGLVEGKNVKCKINGDVLKLDRTTDKEVEIEIVDKLETNE